MVLSHGWKVLSNRGGGVGVGLGLVAGLGLLNDVMTIDCVAEYSIPNIFSLVSEDYKDTCYEHKTHLLSVFLADSALFWEHLVINKIRKL